MSLKGPQYMVSEDQIVKEIELLLKRESLPEEFVAFYRDLYRVQLEAKGKLNVKNYLDQISVSQMELKLREGFHVLDIETVEIEEEPLHVLYENVCEIIEKHGKGEASETEQLKKLIKHNQLELPTFIRKTALKDTSYFESLSEKLQTEKEYLYYLGIQVSKPLFEKIAENVESRIMKDAWNDGTCPVCGNEPAMARLMRDEGRRILYCFLCGTEWIFRRLQCPFCLNDNHETLRFFFAEESSPYRVDVCDTCKRYIKTVDERKLEEEKEVHLAAEDVATLFLDILATDEGYICPEHHILQLEKEGVST